MRAYVHAEYTPAPGASGTGARPIDTGAPRRAWKRRCEQWSRGESNPRARSVSPQKDASSAKRAALGAARCARGGESGDESANEAAPDATGSPVSASGAPGGTEPPDPDLARVTAAWAGLPEAVRLGIVAMVEGVG